MVLFEELVKRLNKLEEKVARKVRGGDSSASGDSRGTISEGEDESGSDEERSKNRKSQKEKILKGSGSMDDIKKGKKGDAGLGAINEEEEKESVHSKSSTKVVPVPELLNRSIDDAGSAGGKSKGSSRVNRAGYPPAAGGGGGGQVSAEYQAEIEAKFEDVRRNFEDIREE